MIETVKIQGDGYLVNGTMSVPKADGNRDYKMVQQWITGGGIVEPEFTAEQLQEQAISHYKGLYLEVVQTKLSELDYDSLATVKLWEDDAAFGVEATRILNWYKAIINKNYQLLNAGTPLTDEQYLAEINAVVF